MEQKIAYCGLDCSACAIRGNVLCKGCRGYDTPENTQTPELPETTYWGGICEIKECAVKLQKVKHCGLCEKFPCNLLLDIAFDPETGDDGARIERLKELADSKITLWDKLRPPLIGSLIGGVIGVIVGGFAGNSFGWFSALTGNLQAIADPIDNIAGYIIGCAVIGAAIPLIINNRKEK
jgi:hypothetical protein